MFPRRIQDARRTWSHVSLVSSYWLLTEVFNLRWGAACLALSLPRKCPLALGGSLLCFFGFFFACGIQNQPVYNVKAP